LKPGSHIFAGGKALRKREERILQGIKKILPYPCYGEGDSMKRRTLYFVRGREGQRSNEYKKHAFRGKKGGGGGRLKKKARESESRRRQFILSAGKDLPWYFEEGKGEKALETGGKRKRRDTNKRRQNRIQMRGGGVFDA